MAPRVLLHVGLQKSGSTYLQHGLAAVADDLERLGLRYPVRPGVAGGIPNHQFAAYGLLPGRYPWITGATADAAAAEWQWLRAQLAASDLPVLLSAEVLSYLGPDDVRRVVDAMGCDDVHMLVTSRRLDRLLTSSWQQNLRHGASYSLGGFLQARADDVAAFTADVDDKEGWHSWRAFDTASTMSRWAAAVGAANVTLVTSPGSPPELLWHRFVAALDVPGLGELAAPEVPTDQANESLRWAEAEVLAAVNGRLAAEGWSETDAAPFRRRLVARGFGQAAERGGRIRLPGEWAATVAAWSAAELDRLRALRAEGLRVVGDVDDLAIPVEDVAPGPSGPAADELAAAAATAVVSCASRPAPTPAPVAATHSRPAPRGWRALVPARVRRAARALTRGGRS